MRRSTIVYPVDGGRCAFDPHSLLPDITPEEALNYLKKVGFTRFDPDITEIARSCIGRSRYVPKAAETSAPEEVDCRTFVAWAYGQIGVRMSRYRLRLYGRAVRHPRAGDLIYVSDSGSPSGGHVGMATGHASVIHAQRHIGVEEMGYRAFIGTYPLREIWRPFTHLSRMVTLKHPDGCGLLSSHALEVLIGGGLGQRKKEAA